MRSKAAPIKIVPPDQVYSDSIVTKLINGKPYYYLKQSTRVGSKVVSKNIAYFGKKKPTKKEIEEKLKSVVPKKIDVVVPKKQDVVPKEKAAEASVVPNKDKLFKAEEKTNAMLSIDDIAIFC